MMLQWMAIPETIGVKMMDVDSARNEIAGMVATGVIRPLLSQARTRLLVPSTILFFSAAASLAASLGMPLWRVALRYVCLTLIATAVSSVHEAYSRSRFLAKLGNKRCLKGG